MAIACITSCTAYHRVATDLENLEKSGNLPKKSGNLQQNTKSQGEVRESAAEYQKSGRSQGILLSEIHFQPS